MRQLKGTAGSIADRSSAVSCGAALPGQIISNGQ